MQNHLPTQSNVAEFGGGGSTLFFLDAGYNVTTVEHDGKWYDILNRKVGLQPPTSTWRVLLQKPTVTDEKRGANDHIKPECYRSSSDWYNSYKEYAMALDSCLDESFDCVLVDGRARPSCIKHSISKVKRGGMLVVDNTERTHYLSDKTKGILQEFRFVLDCFSPTPGLWHFTKTTILQKAA
jgi:hypothetical protein